MNTARTHTSFVPKCVIALLCLLSLLSLSVVEHFKRPVLQPSYDKKMDAINLTKICFENIRDFRAMQGIPVDPSLDPPGSGLIGASRSDITTEDGSLSSKQHSVRPDMAALFVHWLEDLNLEKGDQVAVGMSGSFPAINISMLAAIKTLRLEPLMIFSLGASQYGANIPGLTWADMYHYLQDQGLFDYQPLAVSLGGGKDRFYRGSRQGRTILKQSIADNGYRLLDVQDTGDSIEKRWTLYRQYAGTAPIKAYINIGGGVASINSGQAERRASEGTRSSSLKSGLALTLPINLLSVDAVAIDFLKEGIPVINLHNLTELFEEYDQEYIDNLLIHKEYNRRLALMALLANALLLALSAFLSRKYQTGYRSVPI